MKSNAAKDLRREARGLKEVVSEQALELRLLKKAVICETWRNGEDTLETFVQVTTPANALISRITDRMPAILPRETWPIWLGETDAPLGRIKAVLTTFEDHGT